MVVVDDETIEAVAKALFEADGPAKFINAGRITQRVYRLRAKAAIDCLIERGWIQVGPYD